MNSFIFNKIIIFSNLFLNLLIILVLIYHYLFLRILILILTQIQMMNIILYDFIIHFYIYLKIFLKNKFQDFQKFNLVTILVMYKIVKLTNFYEFLSLHLKIILYYVNFSHIFQMQVF